MTGGVEVRADSTPNPDAVKFTVNRMVVEGRSETYSSPDQALLSPLARALFQVPGVAGVFLLKDFVTIKRADNADWAALAPAVEAVLKAHFRDRT